MNKVTSLKLLSILLFNFINIDIGISQTNIDNDKAHRRYWFYRTRLINDFMKIGKEQGDCIVFAERNYILENPINSSKVGPDQIDLTNMYMMTLALEYKLLTRNHQDVSETVKELYHLLWTVNRLDLEAEQFWDATPPTNDNSILQNGPLNGYALREDMPYNYIQTNLTHFNYQFLEQHNYNPSPNDVATGYSGIQFTNHLTDDNKFSAYFLNNGKGPKHHLTLPQDKYQSLLVALMFINKYIPASVTYNGEAFQDGETSIREEARKMAKRCYDYLNGPNNLWQLRRYNTQNQDQGAITNADGGDAWYYAWPFSRMACMANKNFPWNIGGNNTLCAGFNDPYSLTLGKANYNAMSETPHNCFEDNAVFKAWSQTGSNSGTSPSSPAYIIMQGNTGINDLEWAELMRKVLHQNGSLLRQLSVFATPINEAPCQGPYNFGNCDHGGWEWSSQCRLEHPDARGANCLTSPWFKPIRCIDQTKHGAFYGNYPGIDYMLLHNLYYEYQNQLLDGNQGNIGNTTLGNINTFIYNAGNAVPNLVSSAACSVANAISGFFTGNSNVCNPTVGSSGNGGAGSLNVPIVGYPAYNLMDNYDNNIWPRAITLGQNTTFIHGILGANREAKVHVFQNLKSTARIYATSSPAAPQNTDYSYVTYRAGKEINLLPGFEVEQGSNFHAFILRYVCNGGYLDPMQMKSFGAINDSILTTNLSMDYETSPINPIPIHYIENPESDADNYPVISETDYYEIYNNNTPPEFYKANDFLISPNPNNGKAILATSKQSTTEILSFRIYDMKGQLVMYKNDIEKEVELNFENLFSGIYMIQIFSNEGKSMTKKIEIVK